MMVLVVLLVGILSSVLVLGQGDTKVIARLLKSQQPPHSPRNGDKYKTPQNNRTGILTVYHQQNNRQNQNSKFETTFLARFRFCSRQQVLVAFPQPNATTSQCTSIRSRLSRSFKHATQTGGENAAIGSTHWTAVLL
jgi:hypothetical protein